MTKTEKAPRLSRQARYTLVSYGFTIPYMLVFVTFTVLPVITSIIISFTDFNLMSMPNLVGFQNYITLFLEDTIFKTAFKNTLMFALITGPIGYILCYVFAWMINELRPRARAILTLLFYAPSIAGNMAGIWMLIFSGDSYGVLNGTLMKLGLIQEPIQWLSDVTTIPTVVIIVILWSSLGASFLAFIAGLQGVDRTLYEAGAIDGIRNRWQELYYITLPAMKPQLMFGAVMSISGSFGIGAQITGMVGFPSPDYVVHTLVHHLEDYGSARYEMGYASAIAVLLFVIMIVANKLIQKLIARVGR